MSLNSYLNPSHGVFYKPFFMIFCVVRVLDMDSLNCLIDWIYNFIVKESYTQAPHYFSTIAFHIEITPLADGTYELIQELDRDISKAQANIVELTEAPNSDSEESKSTDPIDTNTGKARCIILLFLNYTIQYCLLVHLSYWSWMKT